MIGIAIIDTGAIAGARIQAFKAFRNRCDVRAIEGKAPCGRTQPIQPSPLDAI